MILRRKCICIRDRYSPFKPNGAIRRQVVTRATPDRILITALDKVLNQINGMVVKEMRKGKTGKAKTISFSATGAGERIVEAPANTLPGRDLPSYLALPLDEYSLLDPTWISRPDPEQPNMFLLKVSLQELMGVNLQPEVRIRVTLLDDRVLFTADEFALGGDPRFKDQFQLDLTSTLRHLPPDEEQDGVLAKLFRRGRKPQQAASPQGATAPKQAPQGAAAPAPFIDVEASTQGAAAEGDPRSMQQQQGEEVEEQHRQQQQQQQQEEEPVNERLPSTPGSAAPPSPQPPLSSTSAARDTGDRMHGGPASAEGEPAAGTGPDSRRGAGEGVAAQGWGERVPPSEDGGPASEQPEPPKAAGRLMCDVKLQASLLLPYPLSVVPGPLLSLGASLVTKASIKGLLPPFLQLLSIDYGRWASGQARRTEAGALRLAPPPPYQDLPLSDQVLSQSDEGRPDKGHTGETGKTEDHGASKEAQEDQ